MASTKSEARAATTPVLTSKEAAEILRRHFSKQPDVVPEGWFTPAQLAEEVPCTERYINKLLTRARERGCAECKSFAIANGSHSVRLVRHWQVSIDALIQAATQGR